MRYQYLLPVLLAVALAAGLGCSSEGAQGVPGPDTDSDTDTDTDVDADTDTDVDTSTTSGECPFACVPMGTCIGGTVHYEYYCVWLPSFICCEW